MSLLIALLVIVVLVLALVGFCELLRKMSSPEPVELPVRWCAACQGQRAFVAGACIVCRCNNAETVRCQIEHCLLAHHDVQLLARLNLIEAVQVRPAEFFYFEALTNVLRQSGSNQRPDAVLNRFKARTFTPPAAALPRAAETPRVQPAAAYAAPAAQISAGSTAIVAAPPIKSAEAPWRVGDAARAWQLRSAPAVEKTTPVEPAKPPEPAVPMAERLTRLLLGLGVTGLAIAALVILTAHDGSLSVIKMAAFAGATAGIFAGGVAFSRWLKLERTANAFYVLAALFMPLNALAAHAFGVLPISDAVAHWGLVALACSGVYAACAGGLRSRIFALLAGVAFIAGAGFTLEALSVRGMAPWLRDALFAALPLGFGAACAAVMRQKFGRWNLCIPGNESLLALLAGRIVGEEGHEIAPAKKLEGWQLLGMPLRLCADGAALVSGFWLVLNVVTLGKPALLGFGLGALELAAFVTLLALGRGWPRMMYATAGLFIAGAMAFVVYFGRGGANLAPVLLAIGAVLYAGELAFARFKRAEFGLPLFHGAIAMGLAAMAFLLADLPRLEIWRELIRAPKLTNSAASLIVGSAGAAALFGVWARRARFEWASVLALLAFAALGLICAGALPVHGVLTWLVVVGAAAFCAARLARGRERLARWLDWQAFAYGVVIASAHVFLHAVQVATPAQLPWMLASAAGGALMSLGVARTRQNSQLAGFAGYLLPTAVLALLRSFESNVPLAPHALLLLFVVAGVLLSLFDLMQARLNRPEFAYAARETAMGGAALVALGAGLALLALGSAKFNPTPAVALNLTLIGAAAHTVWLALRFKQPLILIFTNVLAAPLAVSLVFQNDGDWRAIGGAFAVLALVQGVIMAAPLSRGWREVLLSCGTTLAAVAAILSLGQVIGEASLMPVPALVACGGFFALASLREPRLWMSFASVACGAIAAFALLTTGVYFNALESVAALGCASALAGCSILHASEASGDFRARLWQWAFSLRTLGETACGICGLVALGFAHAGGYAPGALSSPAFALCVAALGLGAGAALANSREEEEWRASLGFLATIFAALGAAFALRSLGVAPHWIGLCLVPAGFGALCGGLALTARGRAAHGYTLTGAGGAIIAGASLLAMTARGATDVSCALTLCSASASLFGARWIFNQYWLSYGGGTALAGAAAYLLHLAGLGVTGIAAGEAVLAAAFVGAGLPREGEISRAVLAQCGFALSAIVALVIGARGAACLADGEVLGTMCSSFTLAGLYFYAARRARLALLDFPAAALVAFGALCAMLWAHFAPTSIALGEALVAAGLLGTGLMRSRKLLDSPLAISGLGLSVLVTLALPLCAGFLKPPAIATTFATCVALAGLHAALAARTGTKEFCAPVLLYVSAAWCVAMKWMGFSAPEVYLLGPALCLAGVGAYEAKVRDVLWAREFNPNVKMALGMALFFVPLIGKTLDLKHGWEVAMVFVSAAIACIASVALKLRTPLRGSVGAMLAAFAITLLMVIPFSRMGFGWWIGIASTLLILTGIALEKRINGWLRSNVAQVRSRFAAAFAGWK